MLFCLFTNKSCRNHAPLVCFSSWPVIKALRFTLTVVFGWWALDIYRTLFSVNKGRVWDLWIRHNTLYFRTQWYNTFLTVLPSLLKYIYATPGAYCVPLTDRILCLFDIHIIYKIFTILSAIVAPVVQADKTVITKVPVDGTLTPWRTAVKDLAKLKIADYQVLWRNALTGQN